MCTEIPCDNCCHKDICKHEEDVRSHIKSIEADPIPMVIDSVTFTVKCGKFAPRNIIAKDASSKYTDMQYIERDKN